jgi:hypothetical protein
METQDEARQAYVASQPAVDPDEAALEALAQHEAWQAYVASQPVVDYNALALEENARLGPFQTGPGCTSSQEGSDALTAFVLAAEKPPPEKEKEKKVST